MILLMLAACGLGLVPLAWLKAAREERGTWWLIAAAFGISFVADVPSLWGHYHHAAATPGSAVARIASVCYPTGQCGLIAAALFPRRRVHLFLWALAAATAGSIVIGGPQDWLLHATAWLGLSGLLLQLPAQPLRTALLVSFGAALLPWLWFAFARSIVAWEAFQFVRAAGIGYFCWASVQRPLESGAIA